ncbi:unnamed protein product [Citrullus colocynthis]|uniref:Uncharacterized protein n=1 Tax=Citrullus colocynthis TaxID=252529 RepID=A0ABP0YZW7_9ROSI
MLLSHSITARKKTLLRPMEKILATLLTSNCSSEIFLSALTVLNSPACLKVSYKLRAPSSSIVELRSNAVEADLRPITVIYELTYGETEMKQGINHCAFH